MWLNDNFLPLAYMNFSKKTKVIQLWHGVGAWKRFGLSTETNPTVRDLVQRGNQRINYITVSGEAVIPFYAEAMGVSPERIIATGIPVTDFYLHQEEVEEARERALFHNPEWQEKKIMLYTPTFRTNEEGNENLLVHFPLHKIREQLGEDWIILIRLHPQIHSQITIDEPGCYDVTEYEDVKELYAVSTLLVNDYSSTMVEYALLRKPIILYAYDLDQYDRGFYRDYEMYAPGPIVKDVDSFVDAVKNATVDTERYDHFTEAHYSILDGKATKRVLELIQ